MNLNRGIRLPHPLPCRVEDGGWDGEARPIDPCCPATRPNDAPAGGRGVIGQRNRTVATATIADDGSVVAPPPRAAHVLFVRRIVGVPKHAVEPRRAQPGIERHVGAIVPPPARRVPPACAGTEKHPSRVGEHRSYHCDASMRTRPPERTNDALLRIPLLFVIRMPSAFPSTMGGIDPVAGPKT